MGYIILPENRQEAHPATSPWTFRARGRWGGMEGTGRRDRKWQAEQAWQIHKSHCERWEEGCPERAWEDGEGCLCVSYESGRWWHYRQNDNGELEWW